MKTVRLALVLVLFLTTYVTGGEPKIGDTVVVNTDQAEVRSKQGRLGTVPLGTQFSVKQQNGSWLLGLFQIEGRSAWGWMKASSVRVMEPEITQQPTHEFTWHNLLLARDKIDDNFSLEDHVDGYMQSARSGVWKQCRYDEFQLEKKRIETLAILKKRLADFDIERDFMLKTHLTFQAYDFKGSTFSINEATEDHYWYGNHYNSSSSLPSRLVVYLKDPKMIGGIPMEPEAAERFVASRKSHYGSIDRKVYANIRLRITGVRSSGGMESEVRWAQFFSDSGRTRLIYETPKSPTLPKLPMQVVARFENIASTDLPTVLRTAGQPFQSQTKSS
jgi:hypothetical protein